MFGSGPPRKYSRKEEGHDGREGRDNSRRPSDESHTNTVTPKMFMDAVRMLAQLLIILEAHGVDLVGPTKNPEVVAKMAHGQWQQEIKRLKAVYQEACVPRKTSQAKAELDEVKTSLTNTLAQQMAQQKSAFEQMMLEQQRVSEQNSLNLQAWMEAHNKPNPTMAQMASTPKTRKDKQDKKTKPSGDGTME